jgi:hypothetical protein
MGATIPRMVDGSRIQEFWAHWQREPNASEEFKRFRIRMTEVMRKLWDAHFNVHPLSRVERFAVISGTPYSLNGYFQQSGLCDLLTQATNVFAVASAVQKFLWTAEEVLTRGNFDHICRQINEAFDLSPGIMIRLARHGDTATIYPTGVRMLDEGVVESTLVWLARYPDVSKHFETALKLYATKDPTQYRNMLDSLRFAVEQMLQAVLNNGKTLENQKEEFLGWLKQRGVHAQIRNMYHTLLFGGFAAYQNDAVKHQEDDYTPAEVEFVFYETGTLLRLIQRLVQEENALAPKS